MSGRDAFTLPDDVAEPVEPERPTSPPPAPTAPLVFALADAIAQLCAVEQLSTFARQIERLARRHPSEVMFPLVEALVAARASAGIHDPGAHAACHAALQSLCDVAAYALRRSP